MENNFDNLIETLGIDTDFPTSSKSFKQIQIQDTFSLSESDSSIEHIVRAKVSTEIHITRQVVDQDAVSLEGKKTKSLKLFLDGLCKHTVEYISHSMDQTIQTTHLFSPFSTYIQLEEHFSHNIELSVRPYIEDVYIKLLNDRQMFVSVLLLLNPVPSDPIYD